MAHLHQPDWLVIAAYVVLTLALGLAFRKRASASTRKYLIFPDHPLEAGKDLYRSCISIPFIWKGPTMMLKRRINQGLSFKTTSGRG